MANTMGLLGRFGEMGFIRLIVIHAEQRSIKELLLTLEDFSSIRANILNLTIKLAL